MAKQEISKRPKNSKKKLLKEHVVFSSKELKQVDLVTEALLDCIKSGDLDSFRTILISHLITTNKTKVAERAGIGRRTLYDLMDLNKEFNPELSTVSAIIRALAA